MDQNIIAPVRGIVKKKRDKVRIITTVFVISFVIVTSIYLSYWYFVQWPQVQEAEIEQSLEINGSLLRAGADYGYNSAVAQIFEEAIKCEPVPITVDNQTINLAALECLQQNVSQ